MSQQGPIIVVSATRRPPFASALDEAKLFPVIAIDPSTSLPENAIPFSQSGGNFNRLIARLRAALRVRTLHSTVMRRFDDDPTARTTIPQTDPARDATVLLIGRGAAYPALSVSLGERMGVVGALSIEAAAKHLSA